jgi:hypothetical protein
LIMTKEEEVREMARRLREASGRRRAVTKPEAQEYVAWKALAPDATTDPA